MKKYFILFFALGMISFVLPLDIEVLSANHLDSNYNFISDIYNEIKKIDNIWSEEILEEEVIRVSYEKNLSNGNVVDVYARNTNNFDAWFEIYYTNTTSPLLGKSKIFNSTGEWTYIELDNMNYDSSVFDFIIKGGPLEFDYIHDATRYLEDTVFNSSSYSVVEGEIINITSNYGMLGTGGSAGDITIGINDTNNNVFFDNSCSSGETFQVTSITQVLCVDCTNNIDGTITLLAPDNGEQFDLIWSLTACPDSSDLSPANLLTQETTTTGAILNDLTGNIDISAAPTLEILYPSNGSTYNTKNLFIKTFVVGNNLDSCWYNLNEVGNVSYNCSIEPSITAIEGYNNLTAYINNTASYEVSDYVEFYVNSSIPLTISITSPENGSIKTKTSPELELLAFDTDFSSINYTAYIYFDNDTLYSIGNNGTLLNNTETTVTLNPPLTLIGSLTTYKIVINATDGVNNATSNVLYYSLTNPAITLIAPDNNYWDGDGNISFSFSVDDAFSNISCSLLIDNVLNQTNESSFTGGVVTTFNVVGISEGINKIWKINCTDPANNTGEASRIFNIDKTNPVVNVISDSPDPVNAGEVLNITANVTDNFGVDYVTVNVSGAVYYMNSVGDNIYYYEYNTTGLSGNYNYSVKGYDNVGNFGENNTGNFYVSDCTYSGSGNWDVDCSDNCSISSNIDLLGNNITITGTGTFMTTANITNFTDLTISGDSSVNQCLVYCSGGGCFK